MKFKDDVNARDLEMIQPALLILITATELYCARFNLPFTITSLVNDRHDKDGKPIRSVSSSHRDGRAADISIRGWSETHVERFVYFLNRDYSDIAAVSAIDGAKRAAVRHDSGYGDHIHLQVRPDAKLDKFIKHYD
jgi:hypothetical protein